MKRNTETNLAVEKLNFYMPHFYVIGFLPPSNFSLYTEGLRNTQGHLGMYIQSNQKNEQ